MKAVNLLLDYYKAGNVNMSSYFAGVNNWSVLGYRRFYMVGATLLGSAAVGLLYPFDVLKNNIENKNNLFFRMLNRYTKMLHTINEELLMRPVANIFGAVGMALGFGVGLLLSVVLKEPPVAKDITKNNQYFSKIQLDQETRRFFAILVWVGMLGSIVGAYYVAPISFLGATFQGTGGLGQLFSMTAVFLYQLPNFIQQIGSFLAKGLDFSKNAFRFFRGFLCHKHKNNEDNALNRNIKNTPAFILEPDTLVKIKDKNNQLCFAYLFKNKKAKNDNQNTQRVNNWFCCGSRKK